MKPSSRGTILVVEDDLGVAHLQVLRLERLGYTVLSASTTEQALMLIETNPVDLIVLDYSIEGDITGVDLFLILRERGFMIPAILVTGFEDLRITIQAMRAGVRDFLPKTPEYLDDLPLAVERVMRQVSAEKQAAESAALREKQELLEAAFDAAKLASWVWDLKKNEVKWAGRVDELLGANATDRYSSIESFVTLVHPEDQEIFKNGIRSAQETRSSFEQQFRVLRLGNELRWYSAKGRFYYERDGTPVRMVGVISDVTQRRQAELELLQSHARIKALNDRLQLSMVESHHRIKNNLQNVVSLLNLKVRKEGKLSQDEVKSLSAHIQGLAVLHDLLVDQARDEGDTSFVTLDKIFEKVIGVLTRVGANREIKCSFDVCYVTPRQAASLTVILNELVSNALKHGTGTIAITLENKDDRGVLTVKNKGSQFPTDLGVRTPSTTGLTLIKLLCSTDLSTEPVFENSTDGWASVAISFALAKTEEEKEENETFTGPDVLQ
jgi:PAS domain S-box-containing protein